MARITFLAGEDFALKLSKFASRSDAIAKRAIYEGANIIADKIRDNLEALPEVEFRRLTDGEKFSGVPMSQKEDLAASFGVTPIKKDKDENWCAKIGFDGYGRFPTKSYPQGIPNQLLARAVESGSSVRNKTPFVRPAVNATKRSVINKMNEVINEEIKKL